ncbi:MAG TPA: OmpA family protein [Candidatus Sulfotelmatobacter sp.]|nr:OmpA family protein [Candidatus Sulfotelmatobacter sp.]
MRARPFRALTQVGLVGALAILVGCAENVEVKKARATLEAARAAGKANQCPADFAAVEDMVKQAEGLCQNCKYDVADSMAAAAIAKTNALCPPPKPTPPPAPAPEVRQAPPAAPSASIAAGPSSIESGACSTLTWATAGASDVSIDNGIGSVSASGNRQVCPTSTTRYTVTATGPGGTRTDSTNLTVNAKGAPAPTPTDKLTIHVNFDTNKSDIRQADVDDLKKAEAFVRKYSACKIEIDGYTDSTGGPKINQPLSEKRADAVKKWILDHGATSSDHITTKGLGASNPIADNKTAKGRFQNRRAEILVYCQ